MPPRIFLTAEWRELVMVNFAIDPTILERHVPRGTTLDAWNGMTLISVVGFRFLGARVLGLSFPRHRDFEEVNLRFYVRREHRGELRRGVVFIKELVPRRAIAMVARYVYNENYVSLPMRHRIESAGDGQREVAYGWRGAGAWGEVRLKTAGIPSLPPPGSQEEFVTEHYWGYVRQRDGSTREYQVEHPRWRVRSGVEARLECDVADLYGEEFSAALTASPASAFLAEGSQVVVRRGQRLGGA